MWEGGNFVKTLPVNPKVSMAEAVVVQKLKVAELGKIAGAMKKVTKVGFPKLPVRRNHTAHFMHVNLAAGVVTATATIEDGKITQQNVETNYELLQCSGGGLLEPMVSVTYSEQDNSLSFVLSAGTEDTDPDDVVYAAVFESGRRLARLIKLGDRGDGGSTSAALSQYWERDNLHVYAFAVSVDGKDASPSVHLTLA